MNNDYQMAISQLEATNMDSVQHVQNIWWSVYPYFAKKTARRCWYLILSVFIIIEIFCADTDIYFDQSGPWIIRGCYFLWMLVSIILVITARNMRDHFSLMFEMKVQQKQTCNAYSIIP